MNQLNEQQLGTHIPIAAWLLIANSLLGMVISLFVFTLMVGAGSFLANLVPAVDDPEAVRIFGVLTSFNILMATVISGLIAGLSIPGLIAGAAMLARKSWARVLGIVVSVFTLVNFPIGTLIGAYALFVLMQDKATNCFASSPPGLKAAPRSA